MQLGQILQQATPPGLETLEIRGVTADSREVGPGDVFVAVAGVGTKAGAPFPHAGRPGAGAAPSPPMRCAAAPRWWSPMWLRRSAA